MRTELWGSCKGISIVCFLLSQFEERGLNPKRVFVWTEIFSKTLLVWTRISFYTDKKDAFSKILGCVWTGRKLKLPRNLRIPQLVACIGSFIGPFGSRSARPSNRHSRTALEVQEDLSVVVD